MNLIEKKEYLRNLINLHLKTKSGNCKTNRLDQLDAWLYGRKFSESDLDFVEKEIRSAIEFFENKKVVNNNVFDLEENLNDKADS